MILPICCNAADPLSPAALSGRSRLILVDLIDRSPDMDAAALGVQFAEMVLRVMPQGPAAVEAADGIDALEALQFRCDGVSRCLTCRDAASAASSHRLQPPSWSFFVASRWRPACDVNYL